MTRRKSNLIGYIMLLGILFSIFGVNVIGGSSLTGHDINALDIKAEPRLAADEESLLKVSSLDRVYSYSDNGYVLVLDTMDIKNLGASTQISMKVCLSDEEMDNVLYYNAYDVNNKPLSITPISEKLNGYHTIEILFNKPLGPFESMVVKVKFVYKNLFTYDPDSNRISGTARMTPIIPYKIDSYSTEIVLPSSATETSLDNSSTSQTFQGSNVPAFAEYTKDVSFTNLVFDYVKIESLAREIAINPLGFIRIRENFVIRSLTSKKITLLTFYVPGDVLGNCSAYDDLGELLGLSLNSILNADGTRNLTLTLTKNRAGLNYGNVMKFTLEYELPYGDYISEDLNVHSLVIDIRTTKPIYIVENESTSIVLMGNIGVESVKGINTDSMYKSGSNMIISITNKYVFKSESQIVDIRFKASGFLVLGRAFLYSLLIILVLGMYVLIRVRRPRSETVEEYVSIPIQELRQFITLYEEKNALLIDKNKADEDLIRGAIRKKAYNNLVSAIDKKIKELNQEIQPYKAVLLEKKGKWSEIIKQLDYLEAEKASVFDSMKLLEQRYKRGKLPSKSAYEKLSLDLVKRIEKAQHKIDRYINELRAFVL